MRPVLFEILEIKVYGYGFMIALGILSAITLLNYRAKNKNYNEDYIFNMAIFAVVLGIIGGKILYIIIDLKNLAKDPMSILTDFGLGFVIYGSIIGGILAIYIYCRIMKWNVLDIVDLTIPSLPLAQGFGRIGCFLAGCCYGVPTRLPIGITFPDNCLAPSAVSLYPTQLVSALFDFLLAAFLLWFDSRNKKAGRVFGAYLIIYSIGRFAIEFFRYDPRGSVGILSTSQFIAIFTLILGLVFFYINNIKGRLVKGEK
ncbi:diacylglyceryl transferase [Clostridium polyendosporum]|uniref:Phosphatidylglycerol--prolipoprotein diacylglyceryl transferase n=1 Tax=Clostridium polyendosporum TaxID=69208 RepID=A0A919S0R4_9CLOT|nr:prolipoprotein diacylglyceryl transferase [Clostridium polyendosporum]GIM29035.1 diacylglyceryl transferase [Clostridium polyendosporum]